MTKISRRTRRREQKGGTTGANPTRTYGLHYVDVCTLIVRVTINSEQGGHSDVYAEWLFAVRSRIIGVGALIRIADYARIINNNGGRGDSIG